MRILAVAVLTTGLGLYGYAPPAQVKVIRAGMSEAEVRVSWGEPLTVRRRGAFSYMFYENGCLKTCGMHDLVILEGGQVTDAIARASYHAYEGVSSSPGDRAPGFTPPSGGP